LVGVGRKGKGTTALVLMDNDRTPLGVVIAPANNHETRHIERLLDSSVVELPEKTRLLYDGAADSDPLRDRLEARGVDLICPHRKNRVKPRRQDGRKLRRKRHRWKIERTNAWLQDYGRVANRKDRLATLFLGWVQLACLFTILKRF
jgi:IS5 family transposase